METEIEEPEFSDAFGRPIEIGDVVLWTSEMFIPIVCIVCKFGKSYIKCLYIGDDKTVMEDWVKRYGDDVIKIDDHFISTLPEETREDIPRLMQERFRILENGKRI